MEDEEERHALEVTINDGTLNFWRGMKNTPTNQICKSHNDA